MKIYKVFMKNQTDYIVPADDVQIISNHILTYMRFVSRKYEKGEMREKTEALFLTNDMIGYWEEYECRNTEKRKCIDEYKKYLDKNN